MTIDSDLPVVVVYEDRFNAIQGVELLARSLNRYSPALDLQVYSPLDVIADRLSDLPRFNFVKTNDLIGRGWNAKPSILLRALTMHERALWLDSDAVITGDIASLITRFDKDTLVVGQEFRGPSGDGGQIRAGGYRLNVARVLPYSVNSGSILTSRRHRKLLKRWSMLLSNNDYRAAQARPLSKRPISFVGDQDALWALLVSEEFAGVELDYFRVGYDMIQHCGANGYHVIDRLYRPFGKRVAFVHMLGRYKPWSFEEVPSARSHPTDYLHLVCFELSPFFEAAQPFSSNLGSPRWLRRRTLPARILNRCFGGNVALRGLPLAFAAWAAAGIGRRPKI